MNKNLLIFCVIIGLACSTKVLDYTEQYQTGGSWSKYLNIFTKFSGECGYMTTYEAGQDHSDDRFQFEEFGFRVYSWANVSMKVEFFSQYSWQVMLSIVPFDVTPYTQKFMWVRPEQISNVGYWDMQISSNRDVHGLWFQTTFQEKFKTVDYSFADYAEMPNSYDPYPTSTADLMYYPEWEMNYEDTYYKFQPMEDYILSWMGNPNWMKWYGTYQTYECWILKNGGSCF